ncbi:monooxygenase family protein [Streptomyces sp. NPDC087787]|uniref:monooxygenase family protein n=1 Tax=Streptomyces sp. NPDC087787 TaxID=3365803 RepID=UPI00381441D8
MAMGPTLAELHRDRDGGLLGARQLLAGPREVHIVQYWGSKEKLLAHATAPDRSHRPAWSAFNRRLLREGRGRVGFGHATYVVPAGAHEAT